MQADRRFKLAAAAAVTMWAGTAAAQLPPGLSPCSELVGPRYADVPVTSPEVGVERSIEVGGKLLSSGQAFIYEDGFTLKSDIHHIGKRGSSEYELIIPAGSYPGSSWYNTLINRIGQDSFYRAPGATYRPVKQKKPTSGKVGLFVDPSTRVLNARIDTFIGPTFEPLPEAQMELHRCGRPTDMGARNEVIFTGVVKGVVTFQYREFMNNIARPAFSQDYSFDLSGGMELAVRGARIRVIRADNAGLRYVVLARGEGAQ